MRAREPLAVTMTGVRMGERVLQIGMTDASLTGVLSAKPGLSGHAAIVLLAHEDFDAIVADWQMDDGNGADVFRWLELHRAEEHASAVCRWAPPTPSLGPQPPAHSSAQ